MPPMTTSRWCGCTTRAPALKAVVGLPFCDIGFAVQGEHLIAVAVEDNLLKGAAAQAVQCLNIRFGFPETQSLL